MMAAHSTNETPVERVISALHGAGRNPRCTNPQTGQWEARCPTGRHQHDDRNPSLGIRAGDNGGALICCQAGCTWQMVAHALGLTAGDLFPPRKVAVVGTRTRLRSYVYRWADGKPCLTVIRWRLADGSKSFTRSPTGVTNVPLYNLPEVLAAVREGRWIIWCEGERDAETAGELWAEFGGVGTCNVLGAGKWRDEWLEGLDGAKIIVVADNDAVGRGHADMLAIRLAGVAAELKVLVPPTPKHDLTDHVQAGLTIGELVRLDAAPEPDTADVETATAGPDDALRERAHIVDWAEFWRGDHAVEEWIAEPVIPGGGRGIALFAPAKSRKSLVMLSIAAAVATGRPILGRPNTAGPRRVLYVDYEMTAADLQERLDDMGYGPDDDLSCLRYAQLPSLEPLDTPAGGQAFARLAEIEDAELVVIDTMGRAVGGEENDNDVIRRFYLCTGLLLKQAGRTFIRLDHAGKDVAKGQRGASAKNDDVDLVWQLVPMQGAVRLTRTHSRVAWVPETVDLEERTAPLGFVVARGAETWPKGTKEIADRLTTLGVPVDATKRAAADALKAAGEGARGQLVAAAQRWRRVESTGSLAHLAPVDIHPTSTTDGEDSPQTVTVSDREPRREPTGTNLANTPGTTTGTKSENTFPPGTEPSGNHAEPPSCPTGNHGAPLPVGEGPRNQDRRPQTVAPVDNYDEEPTDHLSGATLEDAQSLTALDGLEPW